MMPLPASAGDSTLDEGTGGKGGQMTVDPAAKFWDRIAERYSRKPVPDEAVYQKKLQITREHFRPDMEVLEIGCGTGSTAIAHAPYVKHIHAIDISSKMIEIARRKSGDAGVKNVIFDQASIEDISVPDQSVDAVLGLSILHLLKDKEAAIAKVHRMLRPDGIFVTSTACIGDKMKFFNLVAPIGRFFGVMPFVRAFTSKELMDSLIDAGFAIDYHWQPGNGITAFFVARKVASS